MNTKKFNTVWIPKEQIYYEIKQDPKHAILYLHSRKLNSGTKAIITLPPTTGAKESDHLKIAFLDDNTDFTDIDTVEVIPGATADTFFPLDPSARLKYSVARKDIPDGKFKYWSYQQAFQALTIPIQYRPRINQLIPASATANFNIGVGWVHKFTLTTYSKFYTKGVKKKYLNHYVGNVSFSPGIFVAPSAIALTSTNTNGVIKNNTTVLGSTAGIIGVIGYNNLNVGLATGFDRTFGTFGKPWIYNKKAWVGLVFSIDFLK